MADVVEQHRLSTECRSIEEEEVTPRLTGGSGRRRLTVVVTAAALAGAALVTLPAGAGASASGQASTAIGSQVTLSQQFGTVTVNTQAGTVTSLFLRNPDGSLPSQSLTGKNSIGTSVTDSSGRRYDSALGTPASVSVGRDQQSGTVTSIHLDGIPLTASPLAGSQDVGQPPPSPVTEDWALSTTNGGRTLHWTITQHWQRDFAGSADAEPSIAFAPGITSTVWYDPAKIYSPSPDVAPFTSAQTVDRAQTLNSTGQGPASGGAGSSDTPADSWAVYKLWSRYHLASDLRLGVSGGYLTRYASQYGYTSDAGASFEAGKAFTVPAGTTRSLTLTLAASDKYTTGYQLDASIPDSATLGSLRDFYQSLLNGGSVAGQSTYLFGNEVSGYLTGYAALPAGTALNVGSRSTSPTSAANYSLDAAVRGYLGTLLDTVQSDGGLYFGLGSNHNYRDTALWTLLGLYQYTMHTGDLAFFRSYQPAIARMLSFWTSKIQGNGLVLSSAGNGNYYDAISYGSTYYSTYINAFVYQALQNMADLEHALGEQDAAGGRAAKAAQERATAGDYAGTATGIKSALNSVMWTPNSPHGPMYADCIDNDNGQRVYSFTDAGQYPPIVFGIADGTRAKEILATADARLAQLPALDGYTGMGTPNVLWPLPAFANTHNYAFGQYMNGGMFLFWTYYEVMARAVAGDSAGAYARLSGFARGFEQNSWYGTNWAQPSGAVTNSNGNEPYLADMLLTAASLTQGILGVRETWDSLSVKPAMPSGWKSAQTSIRYLGRPYCVIISSGIPTTAHGPCPAPPHSGPPVVAQLGSSQVTVARGGSATVALTGSNETGTAQAMQVSPSAPPGVSVTASKDGVVHMPPNGRSTITLTISANAHTPQGFYSVPITLTVGDTTLPSLTLTVLVAERGSLLTAFNNVGISDDSNATAADFDGGYSYSAQALAAAGAAAGSTVTAGGINYSWRRPSAPGSPDNVVAAGQTVAVDAPAGTRQVGFLGAATGGPSRGLATLTYSDGSTSQFWLGLSDWTLDGGRTKPSYGNGVAVSTPYRNCATCSGGRDDTASHVFSAALPVDPGKTLDSVMLPKDATPGQLHVFAIGMSAQAMSPAADSVSPATASAGQQVTITGSGFGATQGSGYLMLTDEGTTRGAPGQPAMQVDSWSDTAITLTLPDSSGQSHVWPGSTASVAVVTNAGAISDAPALRIATTPNSFQPDCYTPGSKLCTADSQGNANNSYPCVSGQYNEPDLPTAQIINSCHGRLWLHELPYPQYVNNNGWAHCVSPGAVVDIPTTNQQPHNIQITTNTSAC